MYTSRVISYTLYCKFRHCGLNFNKANMQPILLAESDCITLYNFTCVYTLRSSHYAQYIMAAASEQAETFATYLTNVEVAVRCLAHASMTLGPGPFCVLG